MSNELIDIKSLLLLVVSFLNLVLGGLVYFKNRHEKINIYYGLTALATAGWALSLAIFLRTNDINVGLISYRFAYVSAALIGASFLAFSFVFPYVLEKPKGIHKILFYIFTGFVVVISIWPNTLIEEVNMSEGRPVLNDFYHFIYAAYFTMCMIGAFVNFIQKYRHADGIQKIQIRYVFVGTLVAAIWGTTASLYLPLFKIYQFMTLGPYLTVVMVGLIAYAIFKYHLMDIKVILTDILVGIMGVILVMLPFLIPTNLLRILTSAVFTLFCIFGYYLIKATYAEAKEREKAEERVFYEMFQKQGLLLITRDLKEKIKELEGKLKGGSQ